MKTWTLYRYGCDDMVILDMDPKTLTSPILIDCSLSQMNIITKHDYNYVQKELYLMISILYF